MTDMLARMRDIALVLPEAEEGTGEGQATFFVADRPFAQYRNDDGQNVACVRTGDDDAPDRTGARAAGPDDGGWVAVDLNGDVDWLLVEDRIARSWELTAPRRLLEAGGR